MARVPDLVEYCARHGLQHDHRRGPDRLPPPPRQARRTRRLDARCPRRFGEFEAVGYRSLIDDKHHVALVKGEVAGKPDVLVRVHSECLTGDVFHSLRCDCGEQLESALSMIEREGQGVLLYLSQEGRGIGLLNKLRAYRLQEDGLDTVEANERLGLPADLRDYGIGAQILVDLGLSSIRILTNNPKKIRGLEGYGLSVSAQIPIEHAPNAHNAAYLRTKAERMGHTLHHQGLNLDEELLRPERERDEETPRTVSDSSRSPSGLLLRGARRATRSPARVRRSPSTATARSRCSTSPARSSCRSRPAMRPERALRRGRVPRRGDPRRDRPLRLRLRRGRARGSCRYSSTRAFPAPSECSPARRWSRRSRARGATSATRAATPPRPRIGLAALRERARRRRHSRPPGPGSGPLDCRRWQRYVTAAARDLRSVRVAATRWSPPSGASIRTCRRSGSSSARRPGASTSARAA